MGLGGRSDPARGDWPLPSMLQSPHPLIPFTQGASQIAELVSHARQLNPNFAVMAGGGVRPDNVAELLAATGVSEVHSSASR